MSKIINMKEIWINAILGGVCLLGTIYSTMGLGMTLFRDNYSIFITFGYLILMFIYLKAFVHFDKKMNREFHRAYERLGIMTGRLQGETKVLKIVNPIIRKAHRNLKKLEKKIDKK